MQSISPKLIRMVQAQRQATSAAAGLTVQGGLPRPDRVAYRFFWISLLSLLILVFFFQLRCLGNPALVQALGSEDREIPVMGVAEGLEQLDLGPLEEYKQRVDSEIHDYMEGISLKRWIIDFVQGKWELNFGDIVQRLVQLLLKEVVVNSGLLAKLLVLCVLSALLVKLQTSFSNQVAQIAQLACYLALITLAVASFKTALAVGQDTISNMAGFMIAMLPQMLVLTAGLGNLNSAAMLFPLVMTGSTFFAHVIQGVVFPLILISAVVSIINHMSVSISLQRLGKFFTQLAVVALGFSLTIFVGFITMRALYAAVLDKLALRATRFVSDNALPIIGKMFSDTIEVTAGYVLMLKQALGVWAVLIILGMIFLPVVKLGAIALIYKVVAALAEPLGDARTGAVLESMSQHLFLLLAAVLVVALMFFIMIAIVVGLSRGWGGMG